MLGVLVWAVKFWPLVPSLCMAAWKWNMVMLLDMITVENGWKRPKTTVMPSRFAIPPGMVLMCSHADSGECVILPQQAVQGDNLDSEIRRKQLYWRCSWTSIHAATFLEDELWVSQKYVETLMTLGEWRCFLVSGFIACIVYKYPNKLGHWQGRQVTQFLSLAEIQCIITLHFSYLTHEHL